MTSTKTLLLSGMVLAFVAISFLPFSAAEYYGIGGGGKITLEDQLKLAQDKVKAAAEHPGSGSGTPYLNADGVLGGSIIVGAVFGGIATVFVIKSRAGKFASFQKH